MFYRSDKPKRKKEKKSSVHCDVCGFIVETDADTAEFIGGAHMRDPQYEGHKTKVVKP